MQWYSDYILEIFKNRNNYINNYNQIKNKINSIHQSTCITEYDAHSWTGADIRNYLKLFADLDYSDFELQILFEK